MPGPTDQVIEYRLEKLEEQVKSLGESVTRGLSEVATRFDSRFDRLTFVDERLYKTNLEADRRRSDSLERAVERVDDAHGKQIQALWAMNATFLISGVVAIVLKVAG